MESNSGKAYHTFKDVCLHYKRYIERMFSDFIYREDTYTSYCSYIRNIEKWNESRSIPISYIFQFDKHFILEFLEHIYIDRQNSAQTRNNYLGFIRTFCSFLLQNQYTTNSPAEGIPNISRRKIKKERTLINDQDMIRLSEYLQQKNKHYLLASYVLFYCFIRPKEMSYIKIENISITNQTIFIPEDISKNRKAGTVTLPVKVIHLMLELEIFNHPGNHYLFSERYMPGKEYRNEKHFRDF